MCFHIQFKAACGHGFGLKKQCTEAAVEEDFVDYCFEGEPYARNFQAEGKHTCPFCIANPKRYKDPESYKLWMQNLEFPSPPSSTPGHSPQEIVGTLLERYGRLIDGSKDYRLGGDLDSFNRVSEVDLEWLSTALEYVEYSIRDLLYRWVQETGASTESYKYWLEALEPLFKTAQPSLPYLEEEYTRNCAICWKDHPEEIRRQLDLLYFLRNVTAMLATNSFWIDTLALDENLWNSIFDMISKKLVLKDIPYEELEDEQKRCSICWSLLGEIRSVPQIKETLPAESPVQVPCPGKHIFGKDCMERVLKEDARPIMCPYCRFVFVDETLKFSTIPPRSECITPWWIAVLRGEDPQVEIGGIWKAGRESSRPHISDIGVSQEDLDYVKPNGPSIPATSV